MKLKIALAAVALIGLCYLLFSGTAKGWISSSKSDTTYTTIQYAYNWGAHDYRTVTAIKIVGDTVAYLVPLADTVRPIVLDSITKKPKMEIKWPVLPKEFLIVDYGKNWKR